jgi:SprT protein
MTDLDRKEERRVRTLLRRWARVWGLAELSDTVQVAYNPRLRRSLARCSPALGSIALNPAVKTLPRPRFAEVLCHEAAHVAAFRLFGRRVKPHGPKWALLVRTAGYEPHTRVQFVSAPGKRNATFLAYEHRCPVCQQTWLARRPVQAWRCPSCMEAGLSGELAIRKRS